MSVNSIWHYTYINIQNTIMENNMKTKISIYLCMCVCVCVCVCVQSCLAVWDSPDYSPPGSSVHGIPQARTLGGRAISSSRGASPSTDQTCLSCVSCRQTASLPLAPPGSPYSYICLHVYVWMYMYLSHFDVPKKLTQHFISNVLQ